jgi:hypothetical protein
MTLVVTIVIDWTSSSRDNDAANSTPIGAEVSTTMFSPLN